MDLYLLRCVYKMTDGTLGQSSLTKYFFHSFSTRDIILSFNEFVLYPNQLSRLIKKNFMSNSHHSVMCELILKNMIFLTKP